MSDNLLKILGKRLKEYRKESDASDTNKDYLRGRMDELIQLIHDTIEIEKISNVAVEKHPPVKIEPIISETSKSRIIPVPRWKDYYDWPTISGLRHLIFYKSSNGFDKVIRKIGKSVLIDEDCFFEWVEKHKDE